MSSLVLLEYLVTPTPLRIYVPLQEGGKQPLDCVAKLIKSPRLEAEFAPGQLPVQDIDLGGKCLLSLDAGGPTLSLYSTIEQIEGDRKLKLVAIESVSHEQKREFFRVDTDLQVRYWLHPKSEVPPAETLEGRGLNISGGGMLLVLPQPLPPQQKRLGLTIRLAGESPSVVSCIGQVIRVRKKTDGRGEVAVQFESISSKSRDKIVAFCFAEQRKQLRFRVRVVNP